MGVLNSLAETYRRSGWSVDVHFYATAETYWECEEGKRGEAQTPQSGFILPDPWRLASSKGGHEAAQLMKAFSEQRDEKARNLGTQEKALTSNGRVP